MDLVKLYVEEFNLLYVGITRAKYKLHLEKGTKQFMHRVEEYVKPIIASLPAEETHTHPINVVDSIDDVFGDGIPFWSLFTQKTFSIRVKTKYEQLFFNYANT